MKKIQLLSIMILSGAIAFGAQATAKKAQVNFKKAELVATESVNTVTGELVIDSPVPVKGVQFDIRYNTSEIKLITPQQIDNFSVQYNPSLGREAASDMEVIRGLIFSFTGDVLNENPKFEVEFAADFQGTSTIEIIDIILAGENGESIAVDTQSSEISSNNSFLPVKTELSDSYPNPFNPTTSINYGLENDGFVEIMIYDAAGRLVQELVNQNQTAGSHSITWNASNQASGMYFAKMIAGDVIQTQKLVLLK